MNYIVHDTDLDGWCSAALLAHMLGPENCLLRPTAEKDVRRLLLSLGIGSGDQVWVLDLPAPPDWAELETLGGRIKWVDHHMDSWRVDVPMWVDVVLPSGVERTTTMRLLGDRGIVLLQDVSRIGSLVFREGSRWAAAFAGMSKNWPDQADLASLIAHAVIGSEIPEQLWPYACAADEERIQVNATLSSTKSQVEEGLAIIHLDNAQGIPLARYSMVAADLHPRSLVVVVHRRSLLYCGYRTDLSEAFDLLGHFRARGLTPKGHPYVCYVKVGANRIDEEVASLGEVVQQRLRLKDIIQWAQRIRGDLQDVLDQNGHRVHFRPSSTGFAMISLLPNSPQLGKGNLRNPKRLAARFEEEFQRWCASRQLGRPTPEKLLQSFLVSDAQTHGGSLNVLNRAAGDGTELYFVTDEVALPTIDGKIVCDLLAVRKGREGWIPVAIELKSARTMTRLVEQLCDFAVLVDRHLDLFARLASVRMGREICFEGGCEKWIVWPQLASGRPEPHEDQLAEDGIRIAGYRYDALTSWRFTVGRWRGKTDG